MALARPAYDRKAFVGTITSLTRNRYTVAGGGVSGGIPGGQFPFPLDAAFSSFGTIFDDYIGDPLENERASGTSLQEDIGSIEPGFFFDKAAQDLHLGASAVTVPPFTDWLVQQALTTATTIEDDSATVAEQILEIFTFNGDSCCFDLTVDKNSSDIGYTQFVGKNGGVNSRLGVNFFTGDAGEYLTDSLNLQFTLEDLGTQYRLKIFFDVPNPGGDFEYTIFPTFSTVLGNFPDVTLLGTITIPTITSIDYANGLAYASTLYDQSGNGNDAVQGTIANQPLVLNDGTLVFDGGNDQFLTPLEFSDSQFWFVMVMTLDEIIAGRRIFSWNFGIDPGCDMFAQSADEIRFIKTLAAGGSVTSRLSISGHEGPGHHVVIGSHDGTNGWQLNIDNDELSFITNNTDAIQTGSTMLGIMGRNDTAAPQKGRLRFSGFGFGYTPTAQDKTDIYNQLLARGFLA